MYQKICLLLAGCIAIVGCSSAPPQPAAVRSETFMVSSLDPGISLHVRNKRAVGLPSQFPSDRILLMVHGAVVSSGSVFDLELPGGSWMDFLARQGFDVYMMDIRGFGRSTRPAVMQQRPEDNPPFLKADDGVKDVAAVVDFVLKRNNVSRINLLGWSWGTSVMAGYAAQHPGSVERMVLLAPIWHPRTGTPATAAYRFVSITDRPSSIPPNRLDDLYPLAWFEKYRTAAYADDSVGRVRTPPGLRVPNLAASDVEIWKSGRATFDPAAVRAPTLVIVGEWDTATPPTMSQDLYKSLSSAKYKRLIILSEATHVAMLQSNRMQLIREVQLFLEEPPQ
jgi:pimeloyl-ACP methyl ester carboxylesterase